MADFPSTTSAYGIWSLQENRDAEMGDNWPTTAPAVGASYEGGYFAGAISTSANGIADYYLVVAPVASGQNTSKQYKTTNSSDSGASSVIDGPTNSSNLNDANHPAAQFCEGLTIGGYSDWYMPSKQELEVCYYNLKPTTDSNITSAGANPYAVPSRASNYTAGTPAQTSATDFQSTGTEDFSSAKYWSSTESTPYNSTNAWTETFGGGYSGFISYSVKSASYYVRAIRRVAV